MTATERAKAFRERLCDANRVDALPWWSIRFVPELAKVIEAAECEAFDAARERFAHEIEAPYPEDIFPPLNDAEIAHINFSSKVAGPNAIGRLHADWARHWAKLIREIDIKPREAAK